MTIEKIDPTLAHEMGEGYTLPAGKYFIGDPCYVFSNDDDNTDWHDVIELNTFDDPEFTAMLDGSPLAAYGTMYGDGVYGAKMTGPLSLRKRLSGMYPVDAGLIGVTNLDYFINGNGKMDYTLERLAELGDVVDVENSISISIVPGEDNPDNFDHKIEFDGVVMTISTGD